MERESNNSMQLDFVGESGLDSNLLPNMTDLKLLLDFIPLSESVECLEKVNQH